jgi:hypothetical protein
MSDQSISPISAIIEGFQEGREQARRERAARQKDYQKRLIENFNYSPKEFYVVLAKALEARRIPGLSAGLVKLFESVSGSPKRLYMTVDRERFVYYICAAPFGSGFFFSWRLVDERRPGEWYHSLGLFLLVGLASMVLSTILFFPIVQLLSAIGFDALSIAMVTPFVPATFFILQVVLLWSLMRCAAIPGYEKLAIVIERTPIVGRVFERFFRPDTYYRHDSQEMFKKAFENALNETIEAVTMPQGTRKRDMPDAPIVSNLHGK